MKRFNSELINGEPIFYKEVGRELDGKPYGQPVVSKYLKPIQKILWRVSNLYDIKVANLTILISDINGNYGAACRLLTSDTSKGELINVLNYDYDMITDKVMEVIKGEGRPYARKGVERRENLRKIYFYLLEVLKKYKS